MVAMGKRVTETDHDIDAGKRPRGWSGGADDMDRDDSMLDGEAGIMNVEEVRSLKPTHELITPIIPAAKNYSRPPVNLDESKRNFMTLVLLRKHSSMCPVY